MLFRMSKLVLWKDRLFEITINRVRVKVSK